MNKKQLGAAVSVCVLGVIAFIFLYMIGFFDREDIPTDITNNNSITTVSENTEEQKFEDGVTETAPKTEASEESDSDITDTEPVEAIEYKFRNQNLLNQHYEKHGIDMGFESAEEYEKAASAVVNNPNALHKTEAEDGDDVYYVESTNEFVIVSTDGYIRTYFLPDRGIDYYNKQ